MGSVATHNSTDRRRNFTPNCAFRNPLFVFFQLQAHEKLRRPTDARYSVQKVVPTLCTQFLSINGNKRQGDPAMKRTLMKIGLVVCCLVFAGAIAPGGPPGVAQIVALDECDPATFDAAIGPDACKNVALGVLGYSTTISDLFSQAAAGHPNPNWDFEPDTVSVHEGAVLSVV